MLRVVALTNTIFLMAAGISVAAPNPMRQACGDDIKAQCSGVQPKGGALMGCIAQHRDQISDGCKIAIANQMLEHRANKGAPQVAPTQAAPQDQ